MLRHASLLSYGGAMNSGPTGSVMAQDPINLRRKFCRVVDEVGDRLDQQIAVTMHA